MTAQWLGPGPSTFLWNPDKNESSEAGPFVVRLHWAIIDGEARLVGVDLRSVETYARTRPPRPVNLRLPAIHRDGSEGESDSRGGVVPKQFAEITSTEWRAFKFSDVVANASAKLLDETQMLRQLEAQYPQGQDTSALDAASAALQVRLAPQHSRRGRPALLPDSHYKKVAAIVKEVRRRKGERQTLGAIQRAFGGPDLVTRNQAAYWRKRAQQLGYLDPPARKRHPRPGAGK